MTGNESTQVTGHNKPWYYTRFFLIIATVIGGVIGLYLIVRSPYISALWKKRFFITTLMISLVLGALFCLFPMDSRPPDPHPTIQIPLGGANSGER